MMKLALLGTVVLSASVASAQQPPPSYPPASGQQPAAASKQLIAQVVSVDLTGKTITVKKEGAMETSGQMLAVDATALSTLKTVMPGEKVKLTYKTDSSGKETVQSIEKDKSSGTNPQ